MAFNAESTAHNRFDEVLGVLGNPKTRGIAQSDIPPGRSTFFRELLVFRDTARKVRVKITDIRFEDGRQWRFSPSYTPAVVIQD